MSVTEWCITTERLLLKGLGLPDAKALFAYRALPEVAEFQSFRPKTLAEVEEFVRTKIAPVPDVPGTWYQLGIFLKSSNQLVGDIGIHFIDSDTREAEIGYTLSPGSQGNGYATEAVSAVLDDLFTRLNKHRVTASVDPENTKSIALLERLGFRKEAHFVKSLWFHGGWADDVVYAMLEEEWAKKRQDA